MFRSTDGRAWRLALVLALVSPAAALAEPSAADREQALALLKEGLALGESGNARAASERLQQAYALVGSPVIGLELARALAREKRLVEAIDAARRAASVSYADTDKTTAARADATRLADELDPRIPTLRFAFVGAPDGVTPAVSIDGRGVPPAALTVPRKVDPGKHTIIASLPDKREARANIEAVEGKSAEVKLRFEGAPAAPASAPASGSTPIEAPPPATSRPLRTWGLVAAGAGVVGLGLGTFFGLRARSRHDDALGHCLGDVCDDQARSLQDEARSSATVSTVSFIAGGALLAGGAALFLFAPTSTSSPSSSLAPALAPGLLGASWSGRW